MSGCGLSTAATKSAIATKALRLILPPWFGKGSKIKIETTTHEWCPTIASSGAKNDSRVCSDKWLQLALIPLRDLSIGYQTMLAWTVDLAWRLRTRLWILDA
jgi:hypothetical protein